MSNYWLFVSLVIMLGATGIFGILLKVSEYYTNAEPSIAINLFERFFKRLFIVGLCAGVGYILGQFYPLWGELAQFAEPFSPVRNASATRHSIIAGILGTFIAWRTIRES